MFEDSTAGAAVNAPNIHNGTYTLSHEQSGHFTLKLYTVLKGDLLGRRVLALLVGPDNRVNYKGIAFWNDAEKVVEVWRRFQSPAHSRIDGWTWNDQWNTAEKKLAIWSDMALRGDRGFWSDSGYELALAGHCCVCNTKLTHPDSIKNGIGPTCASRL